MFFATLSGKNTDSALPYLGNLNITNVYRMHALKCIHAWHNGILPELFNPIFQYASNVHHCIKPDIRPMKTFRNAE